MKTKQLRQFIEDCRRGVLADEFQRIARDAQSQVQSGVISLDEVKDYMEPQIKELEERWLKEKDNE